VDRLLSLAATRPLREFQDTIPFVRAKRDPTPDHIGAWRHELEGHVARTGGVDVPARCTPHTWAWWTRPT
jgi:hypothetical protein